MIEGPAARAAAEALHARSGRTLPQHIALMDYPVFACHWRDPDLIVC
jgi:hypothetical protein